jgi:hypothetical protein
LWSGQVRREQAGLVPQPPRGIRLAERRIAVGLMPVAGDLVVEDRADVAAAELAPRRLRRADSGAGARDMGACPCLVVS